MIISKKTPSNNAAPWTKADRKTLKGLVKEGKSIQEIADALGRTPAAIVYQKSTMGLATKKVKVKEPKKVKVKTITGEISMEVQESPRDKAKAMTSVARQVARANGKRITMAMFFVEDL